MISYPYRVSRDGSGYLIEFPDVPEALTSAESADEVEAEARDALITALAGYALEGRPWPKASKGEQLIKSQLLVEAKLELIAEMARQRVTNTELGRRLGVSEGAVRRLVDLNHRSHIDQVERGLAALNKRIDVQVRAA